MPLNSTLILVIVWLIIISIITWILIDIKRYPWKYGAKEK